MGDGHQDAEFITPDVLSAAAKALASGGIGDSTAHPLCDRCLGRLFGKLGHGLDNAERGRRIRAAISNPQSPIPGQQCAVCHGLLDEIDEFARLILKKVEAEGVEYATYLVGCRVDDAILQSEKALAAEAGATHAEEIKSEIVREVGKRLGALTGKNADFQSPDLVAVVDTRYNTVEIFPSPLYFYGRYWKEERGLPQTRWPCRECRGKGCRRCGGTGKMYQESVEELVAAPIMEATGAAGHAFHGMGREDIDARMLGTGRPFVIEMESPRRRGLDPAAAEAEINRRTAGRVRVSGLRTSSKDEVVRIKEARCLKTYRVSVLMEAPVVEEKVKNLEGLFTGAVAVQRTPVRVSHRRADLNRQRRVVRLVVESLDAGRREAVLLVTADAGLYVKELVTGDGGRTTPNIADALGVPCRVTALDVIAVHDEGSNGGFE